jgi:hypothetical protein
MLSVREYESVEKLARIVSWIGHMQRVGGGY